MKVTELRIGNYVKFPTGSIYKVDILYDDFSSLLYWMPILLTEEWLFKFGFPKEDGFLGEHQSHYVIDNFKIWRPFDKFLEDQYRVEIKYVHQLQNLYFAITGKELILNQKLCQN